METLRTRLTAVVIFAVLSAFIGIDARAECFEWQCEQGPDTATCFQVMVGVGILATDCEVIRSCWHPKNCTYYCEFDYGYET